MVADFQPGYVDQILIRTGPKPSAAQQQAALDWSPRSPSSTGRCRYVSTSTPRRTPGARATHAPGDRTAGQRPGRDDRDEPGFAGRHAGGVRPRDELSRQVELFADRRIKLAQTPVATVNTATTDTPKSTTIKTFAQLGISAKTSVLGTATLYAGFDASQFAVGSIQEAKVHIIAHYSPVIGGEASVVVRSGDAVLGARRLDESGLLDMTGTIPAESIASNVGLALELRYLPSQPCPPLNDRMQFGLDPASTVAVTPGTFNRGGFPVLPMAFTPDLRRGHRPAGSPEFAAEAINLMAQQTALTLQPRLTTLPVAAASGTGLLVVSRGEALAQAGLTRRCCPARAPLPGSTATRTSMSTSTDRSAWFKYSLSKGERCWRSDGADDWSLVERNFDYIRGLPSRWASLSGDVVATGTAGQTGTLTLREGGPLLNEYPGDSWKWWALLTAGAVVVVLLGTAGALLWRRRRTRQE